MRWVWFLGGWLAVALGGIGIVVPGLPTTVFFIIAAWCFSRSSPRFEQWVLDLPKIGPMVRDHRAGLGMPRRAKAWAVGTMVVFGRRQRPDRRSPGVSRSPSSPSSPSAPGTSCPGFQTEKQSLVLQDRRPPEVLRRRQVQMGVTPLLAVLQPLGRCFHLSAVIRSHTGKHPLPQPRTQ